VTQTVIRLPAWAILAAPVIDIACHWLKKDVRIVVAPMGDELRMYCVVNKEALDLMKGNRGKMVAQGGHAFLHAYWNAERRFPITALRYRYSGAAAKIVLSGADESELREIAACMKDLSGIEVVTDAGRTVFNGPTQTTMGAGPITKADADPALGKKKMLI
jgi:peptidyl-tRNA hydrolase